jgi:hypothetical protein
LQILAELLGQALNSKSNQLAEIGMRRISLRRFDALCYVRAPHMNMMASEVRHYETDDHSNLAMVIFDKTDRDFGYIILGRDTRKLFRCIEVGDKFYSTEDEAEEALAAAIERYEQDGLTEYPQGDETKPAHDIFDPVVAEQAQHDYFKILISNDKRQAARNLIQEIAYSFVDVDGNYIEQFQSTGFDQRLWELFLYVLFHKSHFEIIKSHAVPDFSLSKYGMPVYVEAVTVGQNPEFDVPANTAAEISELSKDYMPIKFGSPLFKKLNRKTKYWDLPHVKGNPFVLAIHDYHGLATTDTPGSMTWSRAGLVNYLYGVRDDVVVEDGQVRPRIVVGRYGFEPAIRVITHHTYGNKTIPSRFFAQPGADNVSAVLFSNGATITTFSRMGKLAGLGDHEIKMLRMGMWIGDDLVSSEPFVADVDADDYDEAWGDTVTMFHNPWAKYPVPEELFPNISHAVFDPTTSRIHYRFTSKHVLTSMTNVIVPV